MRHLTPEQILSAVEQSPLTDAEHAHLVVCRACRASSVQLAAALSAARQVDVPEPSPLFWDHLSDRVRVAVTAEPIEVPRETRWMPWPVLVPLAGLTLVVLVLVSTVAPRPYVGDEAVPQIAVEGTPDSAWALLSDLVGPLDIEMAQQAGIAASLGAADNAVLLMTAAEQEELVRLLRQELQQPGG